jgi:hypothetical protein
MVIGLVAASGCVTTDDGGDDEVLDDKGDRGGAPGFYEVDPSHSSATFRNYVNGAIALLERDDSEIAQLTARSLRSGRVKIDEIVDLTCWDFSRVRDELGGSLADETYARLRQPRSGVAAAISAEIDGYMWSNRIYVSRNMPRDRLAATLVHETNHVINRSEVGYWDDFPTSAFIHEYRAFHAESMFDPTPYDGIDLVDHVIELYELDRDAIDPAVLRTPLTPRLLPDAASWAARDVASDPRDDPDTCPAAP